MARIIQCFVCITVMVTSARTQRGYFFHHEYQGGVLYPVEHFYEKPQARNLQLEPRSENLSSTSQESRKYRPETKLPQGLQRIENGTFKILNKLQINKRGGHRHNLYTILLMELQATLGALDESSSSHSDRVVFPGLTSDMKSSFKPQIPEECRKKGYCESVPNYPREVVEKLISRLGDEVNKFQMDKLYEEDVQIAQRLGGTGTDQEIEMCNFSEHIIYPESAPDKDNKWYTVINLKEKPLQGFRAEMCIDTKLNQSSLNILNIQPDYKATCKQKYVFRMMEVIDEVGNHVQKPLKLPSCCSPVLIVTNSLSN